MASRKQKQRLPEQRWRQRQQRRPVLSAAVAATLIIFPATVAAASRRVQQEQQSDADLIELFDQVTNNQATTTGTSSSIIAQLDDVTLEQEEVVSGGTVYATCPNLSAISAPLYESDANSDGFINQEEYVQFTDVISGGFLSQNGWESGFNDMPLALQETYLVLSCLCELYPGQPWGGVGCCKTNDVTGSNDGTGIRTDGAQPGTTPDADQLQYLTYVCGTMSESLKSVGGTIVAPPPPPTTTPSVTTSEPTTTLQPVLMPVRYYTNILFFHVVTSVTHECTFLLVLIVLILCPLFSTQTPVPEPTDEPTIDIITSTPTKRVRQK